MNAKTKAKAAPANAKSTIALSDTAKPVTLVTGEDKARVCEEVYDMLLQRGVALRDAKSLRKSLAGRVAVLFDKPVTVAQAADTIGINLSTRGEEYTDEEKAAIQNARVSLGRALADNSLLLKNKGKGRKARQTEGEGEEGNEAAEAVTTAKGKKELVSVMLGNLANLSDAGLERLMNGIVAERARRTEGQPAKAKASK